MLHLIDNILELARIENNQATLDETITDVSKNFDLCIDMFRKPIEEKHQTLKVNKNIRYPYLHMDDARSSEITINILSNAVKYTGEGGNISCTLNQYPGEKEGWSVLELIIADNGIGMSEEFQKHIFGIIFTGTIALISPPTFFFAGILVQCTAYVTAFTRVFHSITQNVNRNFR